MGSIARAQDTEVAVNVADATEAGDNLLADITTFGGADGVGFEARLGREGVGPEIDPPSRKAAGDAEEFPI